MINYSKPKDESWEDIMKNETPLEVSYQAGSGPKEVLCFERRNVLRRSRVFLKNVEKDPKDAGKRLIQSALNRSFSETSKK